MRAYIDEIAASIVAEVAGAAGWRLRKHQPLWTTTEDVATLYVYGARRMIGEFRTTGSREDIFEIILEYREPADDQEISFERSEAAEAALDEKVDALVTWADNHEQLTSAHRLDYVLANYAPATRRQLPVRAFEVVLQVRDVATYG
jgi:hypothetical protein